jgi:hypothetical protein
VTTGRWVRQLARKGRLSVRNLRAPYDPARDAPDDAYLERYAYWGLNFLDAASWRHYLPRLIDYTLRHGEDPRTMVVAGLLCSLRPPDREPPRLATLTPAQEAVITAFLDDLAFSEDARASQEDALLILEEWWLPNARYRPRPDNPEHIHLFSAAQLTALLRAHGAARVVVEQVPGHLIAIATVGV